MLSFLIWTTRNGRFISNLFWKDVKSSFQSENEWMNECFRWCSHFRNFCFSSNIHLSFVRTKGALSLWQGCLILYCVLELILINIRTRTCTRTRTRTGTRLHSVNFGHSGLNTLQTQVIVGQSYQDFDLSWHPLPRIPDSSSSSVLL